MTTEQEKLQKKLLKRLLETVDNTTVLGIADWDAVNQSMKTLRGKWIEVGSGLNVAEDFLDELEDEKLKPERSMNKTLRKWLENYGNPTWRMLAGIAGRHRMDVAKEIAANHPVNPQQPPAMDGGCQSTLKRPDIADCYNMPKLNRGVVLIIVNVNFTVLSKRVGAEKHAEKLKSCWEKLGYSTIITKEDLTADDIITEFKKSAKLASDDKYHSFVCCISSHGSTGGISGTDDNGDKDTTVGKVKIEQLTKFLAEDEVKNLRNKPKMFFIQACRGVARPAAIPYDGITSPLSDFFIAYATSPYTKATRNWYITELCEIFESKYTDNDLQRMHTMVNNNVVTKHHDPTANYKQQPQIDDKLNRQVWFNRP